jgi:chromosome segregation ATPase
MASFNVCKDLQDILKTDERGLWKIAKKKSKVPNYVDIEQVLSMLFRVMTENIKLQNSLGTASDKLKLLEKQQQEKEKKFKDFEAQVLVKEYEIQAWMTTVNDLQEKLTIYQSRIERLERELKVIKTTYIEQKTELETNRAAIKRKERQIVNLKAQLEAKILELKSCKDVYEAEMAVSHTKLALANLNPKDF